MVECTSLFLNNNELRHINNLSGILESVMYAPHKLQWLDLSYNYLVKINDEIPKFTQLKTLHMNNNYIYSLEEVVKLQQLEHLRSIKLYGNPIEQIKGYRLYVLGILLGLYNSLTKMDSVIITKKEKDGVYVWNQRLFTGNSMRLRRLDVEKPAKPPKEEEEADDV